ncbi:uncharacterized protein I206_107049 [Kwoniella pini CBS 10737]|uniref:Mediator of RNA polymerase II transcription subunit 4 n=1 Tax=Kwoniella pini CBS 10737 TaxID=1296096 RepID=A0A1B9HZG6_9TREE|nr:uncharacterized protein I206_05408 [Kwoniella pini CBS 10737]OCF48628.1 hypothetical protein I206_05408 [Kwoniella pini CBS 10737]
MVNEPFDVNQSSSSSSSSNSLPPRQALLQNLTTQSILLSQLFNIFSNNLNLNSNDNNNNNNNNIIQNNNNIEQIYTGLKLSTLDLSNLIKDSNKHQKEYLNLIFKKKKIEILENKIKFLIKNLENGRLQLENMIEIGKKMKISIEQSEKNIIQVPSLLAQSQRLAKYSSAPISNLMSNIDKNQFQPWPNEMMMRMGLLFQMGGNEGMGGMGKKGKLGDEIQSTDNAIEQPQNTIIHEEPARRYDPNAVFTLDLNSDDSDDD